MFNACIHWNSFTKFNRIRAKISSSRFFWNRFFESKEQNENQVVCLELNRKLMLALHKRRPLKTKTRERCHCLGRRAVAVGALQQPYCNQYMVLALRPRSTALIPFRSISFGWCSRIETDTVEYCHVCYRFFQIRESLGRLLGIRSAHLREVGRSQITLFRRGWVKRSDINKLGR